LPAKRLYVWGKTQHLTVKSLVIYAPIVVNFIPCTNYDRVCIFLRQKHPGGNSKILNFLSPPPKFSSLTIFAISSAQSVTSQSKSLIRSFHDLMNGFYGFDTMQKQKELSFRTPLAKYRLKKSPDEIFPFEEDHHHLIIQPFHIHALAIRSSFNAVTIRFSRFDSMINGL
jgi:hypothetical protein